MQKNELSKPLIELYDEAVSAADLEAQALANLAQRRASEGDTFTHFPSYGSAAVMPEIGAELPQLMNLRHHLRWVNKSYNQMNTTPLLVDSPATRVPLLGAFWKRIRHQAHQLVLFYVNRLVGEQTAVNRHITHSLNELTRLYQEQQQTLEALKSELNELKQNLDH